MAAIPLSFAQLMASNTAIPEVNTTGNPIVPPAEAPPMTINVTGRVQPGRDMEDPRGPMPPNMGNSRYLDEVSTVNRDNERRRDGRTGLFGIRGTLRDILGTMSDSWLDRTTYRDQRRQENLSDAMAGFTADPIAAAERMAYYDSEEGQAMLRSAQEQQLRQAQQESLNASREDQARARQATQLDRARENVARLLATPGAFVDGVISPDALAVAEAIARANNTTLDALGITPDLQEDKGRLISGTDLSVYQGRSLGQRQQGLGIQQQNANTNEFRARTAASRPTSSGRNPTEASIAAPLLERLSRGERLTAEEMEVLNRTAPLPAASRSRTQPRTPPGTTPAPANNGWSIRRN